MKYLDMNVVFTCIGACKFILGLFWPFPMQSYVCSAFWEVLITNFSDACNIDSDWLRYVLWYRVQFGHSSPASWVVKLLQTCTEGNEYTVLNKIMLERARNLNINLHPLMQVTSSFTVSVQHHKLQKVHTQFHNTHDVINFTHWKKCRDKPWPLLVQNKLSTMLISHFSTWKGSFHNKYMF